MVSALLYRYAALRRQLLVDPHVPKDGGSSPDVVIDNPLSQNPGSLFAIPSFFYVHHLAIESRLNPFYSLVNQGCKGIADTGLILPELNLSF